MKAQTTVVKRPLSPEELAEVARLAEARERASALQPAIARALARQPGAWAIYTLLRLTATYQETAASDPRRSRCAVESAQMRRFLALLRRPTWQAALELERDCKRTYNLLNPWVDGPTGMAEKLARALGVTTGQDSSSRPRPRRRTRRN